MIQAFAPRLEAPSHGKSKAVNTLNRSKDSCPMGPPISLTSVSLSAAQKPCPCSQSKSKISYLDTRRKD